MKYILSIIYLVLAVEIASASTISSEQFKQGQFKEELNTSYKLAVNNLKVDLKKIFGDNPETNKAIMIYDYHLIHIFNELINKCLFKFLDENNIENPDLILMVDQKGLTCATIHILTKNKAYCYTIFFDLDTKKTYNGLENLKRFIVNLKKTGIHNHQIIDLNDTYVDDLKNKIIKLNFRLGNEIGNGMIYFAKDSDGKYTSKILDEVDYDAKIYEMLLNFFNKYNRFKLPVQQKC